MYFFLASWKHRARAMRYVISAASAPPHLLTANLQPPSARGQPDRMGCSTSSQTSAVDTTRPSSKPEESNGASTTGTTGAANKSGNVAEDSETIPDQTPAPDGDEPVIAPESASCTSAAPPAGEEPDAAAASPPADGEAPAADSTPEAAASSPEPAAAAPEQESGATDTESKPSTDEAPAPSE